MMRIGRLTIVLLAMATFTTAGLSVAGAANAAPTDNGLPIATYVDSDRILDDVATTDDIGIQVTCYSAWLHSGHTANVNWYHCHPTVDSPDVVRVHICGNSGTLHGIYVGIYTHEWQTAGHRHDDGGEGC